MKKYYKLVLSLMVGGLLLSLGALAKAEEGSNKGPDRPMFNGAFRAMQEERKDDRQAFRTETKEEREAHRQKMAEARKAFMDKLKTDRDAFKLEVEKRKAEWKSATLERRKEFWGNVGEMLSNRFAMAVKMLEDAQTRVGDAITKLKNDGKDTTDATNYLNLSKGKLADAKAKLDDIKDLLPATGDKITAEIFEQIKIAAREAKDLLKESKEDLKSAIKEIKDLKDEGKENDDQ